MKKLLSLYTVMILLFAALLVMSLISQNIEGITRYSENGSSLRGGRDIYTETDRKTSIPVSNPTSNPVSTPVSTPTSYPEPPEEDTDYDLYVREDGGTLLECTGTEDVPVNSSGECALASINDAISEALDGDTIKVDKGVYNETVIIDREIELIGNIESPSEVTIVGGEHRTKESMVFNGGNYDGLRAGVIISSEDVMLRGFQIDGRGLDGASRTSDDLNIGVAVGFVNGNDQSVSIEDIEISDNHIRHMQSVFRKGSGIGILIQDVDSSPYIQDVDIERNEIEYNRGNAIFVQAIDSDINEPSAVDGQIQINFNHFEENFYGQTYPTNYLLEKQSGSIRLEGFYEFKILNNSFSEPKFGGIFVGGVSYGQIGNNDMVNPVIYGISYYTDMPNTGIDPDDTEDPVIAKNNVRGIQTLRGFNLGEVVDFGNYMDLLGSPSVEVEFEDGYGLINSEFTISYNIGAYGEGWCVLNRKSKAIGSSHTNQKWMFIRGTSGEITDNVSSPGGYRYDLTCWDQVSFTSEIAASTSNLMIVEESFFPN